MKSKKDCLSINEITQRLTVAGVNPTAQRLTICQYVMCEADHPTADDVKAWADLNFPKMSLATVYNTLNTLVQAGLLKEYKFPHSDKVIYDDNLTKHYHFFDEETGRLIDLPLDRVEITPKLGRGLKINDIDVVIRGTQKKIIKPTN